jgi:hypothetical protein
MSREDLALDEMTEEERLLVGFVTSDYDSPDNTIEGEDDDTNDPLMSY